MPDLVPLPPSPVRPARRRSILGVLLAALMLAGCLLALGGVGRVAHAQSQDPDAVLYVTVGGMTSDDCKRELVPAVIDPPVPAYYSYANACDLDYAIQVASDDDASPDTLWIAEGDYSQSVEITKSIHLVGGFIDGFVVGQTEADPVAYPLTSTTRILGAANLPAITIEAPLTTTVTRTVTLDGLYVQHQTAAAGQGISVTAPISPNLSGLRVDLHVVSSWVQTHTATTVGGGLVVPADATARLRTGAGVELTIVRSDANDPFTNSFTASLASSLAATLNASLPGQLAGAPTLPLVTVAADTVATTPDFRFATLPGFLLLPLWIAGVAFAVLLSRAGDHVRGTAGAARTGVAEALLASGVAAVAAAVVAIDVALFTWRWDLDLVGLFALMWLALTAITWLLLGTVRTFGAALGAVLGVVALFLQQPVSGATYPAAFAPDVVRWAEPIAPLRYLVEGTRDVLIGGTTLGDMAIALAGFAIAGLALVAVGIARLALQSRPRPAARAPMPAA